MDFLLIRKNGECGFLDMGIDGMKADDALDKIASSVGDSFAMCKTSFGNDYRLIYKDTYGWNTHESEYIYDENKVATKMSQGTVVEHDDCAIIKVIDAGDDAWCYHAQKFNDDDIRFLVEKIKEYGGEMMEDVK